MSYASVILAESSLQSYWPLGEGAGTTGAGSVIDTAPTSPVNGTPTAVTFGSTGLLTSAAGSSASFPGSACGIDMGTGSYSFGTTVPYTVEAWINMPTVINGTSQAIIGKWQSSVGYILLIDSTGHARTQRWRTGALTIDCVGAVLSNGTTYHLVYTYDGTNSRLYVNAGAPTVSATDSNTLISTAPKFGIGAHNGGDFYYFNGKIAHAAVYNAALTAAQITAHYAAGISALDVPQWQATGTAAEITTTALTVAWPTHATDDIGLLFVETAGGSASPSLTTANGFAQVTNSPQSTGAGTAGTKLSCFWCRATSAAMGSPVLAGVADHQYGVIVSFRGCGTTGNPHITSGGVKASATTTTTTTGVTTTAANCLIVEAVTSDLDSAAAFASAQTNAALGTITERFDAGTALGLGGGIAVHTGTKATAGATGATAVTVTSSIGAFMTIALAPQAAVAAVRSFRTLLGVGV